MIQELRSDDSEIPVFRPSYEEFKDFKSFIASVESFGHQSGIIKIIPPQEWVQSCISLSDLSSKLHHIRIKNPISQDITGGGLPPGIYRQFNVENRKTYSGMLNFLSINLF